MNETLERVCSNCLHCRVVLNRRLISTREIDENRPFESPAIVKSVQCGKLQWLPLTSLALLQTVDNIAKQCSMYEEND